MEGYRPETYGDRIADVYDRMTSELADPMDCVDRLAELAGPGPALDLMARLAGLRLRERWGGWRREPFTASTSGLYVSVYERAGAGAS